MKIELTGYLAKDTLRDSEYLQTGLFLMKPKKEKIDFGVPADMGKCFYSNTLEDWGLRIKTDIIAPGKCSKVKITIEEMK